MASLRQIAACIGISGTFSVLGDFYGFFLARVPDDPTGVEITLSLLQQIRRLQKPHFHLDVTAVGSDNFTGAMDGALDYSLFKIRNVYAQAGVGVGRVRHHRVLSADAQGLDVITSEGEMETITDTFALDGDSINVLIPASMNVPSDGGMLLGKSAIDGPCEEKDDKGLNGSCVGPWGSEQMARTMAHEVGHYLGLTHRNDEPENLMCQSGKASSIRDSILIDSGQADDIKDHCLVHPSC
ncbi:MAG TPA: zinc-dependent metalloprotease family protein [Pyrinomonadaceae bacterium]|nr:zinc-dependent metalloprotease family protein [Pyrinomonadaceae bacterium]